MAREMTASRHRRLRFGLAALVVGLFVAVSSDTKAEFEVPLINNANQPGQPEFHGLWSFDRGLQNGLAYNGYEAYAVGIDKSITGNVCRGGKPADYCNGIFYFYNGSNNPADGSNPLNWRKVGDFYYDHYNNGYTPFALNAVVGQGDPGDGTPTPLFVVGAHAQIAEIPVYYSQPDVPFYDSGQFFPETLCTSVTPDGNSCAVPLSAADQTKDFYAVDAAQLYNQAIIAGGQNGLVFKTVKGNNTARPWARLTPNLQDPAETITGIKFSNLSVAYVTTSTFAGAGLPAGALDRTCAGTQTSRLYKIENTSGAPAVWTRLETDPGICYYGLAIATRNTPTGAHGPLQNVIFIATSNGVKKYDEASGGLSTLSTTPGKKYYSVVATQDNGLGQQLLYNGGFESLVKTPLTTDSLVDGWYYTGHFYGPNHTGSLATCEENKKDKQVITPGRDGTGYAFQVQPDISFFTANCAPGTADLYYTEAILQSIPLSTIEGQQFHITGWYKVEFPALPNGFPPPPAAQGGVVIGCSGNFSPNFIDCSTSNRSLVRTPNNPTNGWAPIDLTISREDLIFGPTTLNGPGSGSNILRSVGKLTPRKMMMDIRCEATYGAKVTCDDLRVEEISSPPTTVAKTVNVLAAGEDLYTNHIAFNPDALAVTDATTFETLPPKVYADHNNGVTDSIYAMSGVSKQHVFAAGAAGANLGGGGGPTAGLMMLDRTPSTLTGTIWAGLASPTSTTASGALGPISVSCVNDRMPVNTGPSLCQLNPDSYGVSLQKTLSGDTFTGTLAGRAWFGKPVLGVAGSDFSDQETLNLGSCQNPPLYQPDATKPYYLGGLCDNTSRRCWANAVHRGKCTLNPAVICSQDANCAPNNGTCNALANNSCLTDFDCFGRCQADQGFLCVTNADCKNTGVPAGPISADATGVVKTNPVNRLTCGRLSDGVPASPLACRSTGWLSFNAGDFPSPTPPNPPGGSFGVNYNTTYTSHNTDYPVADQGAHELSGWARFMTPANPSTVNYQDTGWVHLRGANISASGKLFACRDCVGGAGTSGGNSRMNCSFCQDESNQSCVPTDTLDGNGDKVANCHYVCDDNTTPCTTNAECGTGQCKVPGYCTGDGQTPCTTNSECNNTVGGHCATGAICSPTGSLCAKYGVNLDTETGKFYGYAWSQDFGWLDFQQVSQGGSRLFQTRLGDIYAQGAIGSSGLATPPSQNNCNGTYIITSSSTITNFCSSLGTQPVASVNPTQPYSSIIPFPGAGNVYQNALGRFDLKGLETVTDTSDIINPHNKFGMKVRTNPAASGDIHNWWIDQGANGGRLLASGNGNNYILGGNVYRIGADGTNGTYSLNSLMTFANSTNLATDGSGAGILIVNGNLTINASPDALQYATAPVTDLRQLASLVVVVKGNLTIANTVKNLVGTYYVQGTFQTADSPSNNQYQLIVRGLVIAKKFLFYRQFAGTIENPLPSELFVYDGRLQSNPLPGMTDFANVLPNSSTAGP